MKYDAIIRNWRIEPSMDMNDLRIRGIIYNDNLARGPHPFADGEPIVTSKLIYITCDHIAHTKSGSKYLLVG